MNVTACRWWSTILTSSRSWTIWAIYVEIRLLIHSRGIDSRCWTCGTLWEGQVLMMKIVWSWLMWRDLFVRWKASQPISCSRKVPLTTVKGIATRITTFTLMSQGWNACSRGSHMQYKTRWRTSCENTRTGPRPGPRAPPRRIESSPRWMRSDSWQGWWRTIALNGSRKNANASKRRLWRSVHSSLALWPRIGRTVTSDRTVLWTIQSTRIWIDVMSCISCPRERRVGPGIRLLRRFSLRKRFQNAPSTLPSTLAAAKRQANECLSWRCPLTAQMLPSRNQSTECDTHERRN